MQFEQLKTLFYALLAVLAIAWVFIYDPFGQTVRLKPGMLAPEQPTQVNLPPGVGAFEYRGYTVLPMAAFYIKAKVLSKENYSYDLAAEVSPIDLALGWGPMSDQRIIDQFSFWQRGRGAYMDTSTYPLSMQEMIRSYSNIHLIPSTEHLKTRIDNVRDGEIIEMTGMLVHVINPSTGFEWTTSLSREDTGEDGCEIMWVNEFKVLPIPEA